MRQRRILGASSAALLIAALLTAASPTNAVAANAVAANGPAMAPGQIAKDQPRTVTLITGDRVTLHAKGNIAVPPRGKVRFLTYSNKDHRYVIPSDALALLRDGHLDRRLFDVNALLDAGYDSRDSLPLIITGIVGGAAPQGFAAVRALPVVKGYAVKAGQAQLRDGWRSLAAGPGVKIWLDGMRKPSLDVSVPLIGAPAAWAAGLDGTGVKVAVLDTGIDSTHPDLAGKISAVRNFTEGVEDDLDRVGHGTHVASTIAGSGAASGGAYRGVAPGATLLVGKVCVNVGCPESWILAGMQWAAESGAQVVNLSLGGGDGPEIDPLEQAVNDLTARYGTLFVIAAGNAGSLGDGSLMSPASADAALAVGAVNKSEVLADFSGRGPRVGDAGVKPEITAPGVDIIAARSKDGSLGEQGQLYMSMSGTSMATPHVAGAAAILTQQHPMWTARQRKAALTGSADPNPTDGPFAQGAGRADVARAVTANVVSDPATVGFGIQAFPHEDDPVVAKDITYTNGGTGDVTLQLALTDPAGGVFSLSASTLTVPAGGSASVKLISDTRQGTALSPLGGRVVATADGVRVQTPYGVEREEKKFTLHLPHTDRAGNPARDYLAVMVNLSTLKEYFLFDADGTVEIRVPAGDYMIFSSINDVGDNGSVRTTLLMRPRLTLDVDRTLRMDARNAGPIQVTIPDRTLDPLLVDVTGALDTGESVIRASLVSNTLESIFTGHVGPKPVPGFTSSAQIMWGKVVNGQLDQSLVYNLAWPLHGSFPTGFTRDMGKRDLVTIQERIYKAAGHQGYVRRFPVLPTGNGREIGYPQVLPATGIRVINAEVPWGIQFNEEWIDPEGRVRPIAFFSEDEKVYEAGRTVQETFNRAMFGPVLARSQFPQAWVTRTGDEMIIFAPLFGDGSGRTGFGVITGGRTALYRDGELVGEVPFAGSTFTVPAGNARYRAEMSAQRGEPFRLGTNANVVWTFNSSHVDQTTKLPVTTLGFSPPVDDHNVARAGVLAVVAVNVWQQPGSDAKRLKSLDVDVSFDDGTTWREVPVINLFGNYLLVFQHPSTAGFVSLRAKAVDRAGNTVAQTVIHAYEIK